MPEKIRADTLLVEQGLAPTRTRAQSLIMSGTVYHGTQRVEKPSQFFLKTEKLLLKGKDHPFVSRGGLKLQAAIDFFKIDVTGKVCIDVGASTGGFTDCLLKSGAKKVYSLDVGYGQLDWSLMRDPRVVIIDKTNFRYFNPEKLEDDIDIITIDASFISLKKLIPKALEILKNKGVRMQVPTLIFLIKPQFEVGKKNVGKGGIVKNKEKCDEVVEEIKSFCISDGLKVKGVIPSPILGREGNKEFLLVATYIHRHSN